MSAVEVPLDAPLLRAPRPTPDFTTPTGAPTHKVFEPSTKERNQVPVAVSVWDETQTYPPTILLGFRDPPLLVFRLLQSKRARVQSSFPQVCAIYMDVAPEHQGLPGSTGHAGLLGLLDVPGPMAFDSKAQKKAFMKELRLALADCCDFVCRLV